MPPKSHSTTSPSADHAVARVVVRARRVGARRRRWRSWRARGPPSSIRSTSSRCTSSSVRPANGRVAHRRGDVVDDARGGAQRVDLGRVLHDPQRAGDVGRPPERDVGQRRPAGRGRTGPTCGRRSRRRARRRARRAPATTSIGSSVSSHGIELERVGLLDDPRRLEPRDHEHRVAVGRHARASSAARAASPRSPVRYGRSAPSRAAARRRRARPSARARAPRAHRRSRRRQQRAEPRPDGERSVRRGALGVVAGADERPGLDVARSRGPRRRRPARRTRRASTSARPAGAARDGRRYWPSVRMSTPTLRRSAIAPRSSSAVSPMPRMMPDLVSRPASLARPSSASDRK